MAGNRKLSLIALGGNLPVDADAPQATLSKAIAALQAQDLRLRSVSRFFRTPCFPAGAGPDYVNAAVAVETSLSAEELLARLHEIEAQFARVRDQRWGMRTLDLDLLDHGGAVLPDAAGFARWLGLPLERQMQEAPGQLILPHPRIQDRAFVLVPLKDIAPRWRHPVLQKTVTEMLADLPPEEVAEPVPL
ncbi:2-amino-4-hydroxy-6-hydroxymethyldihydropteridine diphosphokinase [Leisingera caerulea]|uniref:2-amino-4-hydroxy-6-hydroxymethyldihydropteridine pyrophosphokinase n=1 Tax=Leisingera caerulea TaxID=506591 RepID=A0A9Q9HJU2_LEICA|nr:2-amino-4-hydroxy-6-hydroxymethyldihydropteridine diphosphokinase [Leisingera caerulea]UWQ54121.1 2-amino-4-hydroxy-6-hydroxymethyldihydropteridine diphosphokinase [Leisingera caerulea]UWQ58719.1 2-amino-4-hydroxy-6-hydroxymethyldihydropteridine diphosphokinase [Leisingera caerulea]